MVKRTKNQSTGDIGETSLQLLFNRCGYAVSKIDPDLGEDFFVFGQDGEDVEPFKIFVQSKASATFDTAPSDWTEYVDSMTVRNWVSSNDLTVVIRQNFADNEARYCIPEDDIDYWDLKPGETTPVRLWKSFDVVSVGKLVARARVRHYHRLIHMSRPNEFSKHTGDDVPAHRKYIAEFLLRHGVLNDTAFLDDSVRALYNSFLGSTALVQDFPGKDEMSLHEKLRYAACYQLIVYLVGGVVTGGDGIDAKLADDCAALLVQFVIAEESNGRVIQPRDDATWHSVRRGFLKGAIGARSGQPILTEWFPVDIVPAHVGVYQRDDGDLFFSFWDGVQWCGRSLSFEDFPIGSPPDSVQELLWRGTASMSAELAQFILALVLDSGA